MKKILIVIFVLGVLFIAACNKQPVNSERLEQPPSNLPTNPQVPPKPPTEVVKSFDITAKQWEFSPSTITVNEGDTVKIKVKSLDVTHGFGIAGYNINKVISPGQEVSIELKADQKGTFNFICTVPCGPGHSNMKGKLVVN